MTDDSELSAINIPESSLVAVSKLSDALSMVMLCPKSYRAHEDLWNTSTMAWNEALSIDARTKRRLLIDSEIGAEYEVGLFRKFFDYRVVLSKTIDGSENILSVTIKKPKIGLTKVLETSLVEMDGLGYLSHANYTFFRDGNIRVVYSIKSGSVNIF